jgi:hypothetical protein
MGGAATTILVTAVVAIAVVQIGLLVLAIVVGGRLLRELAGLSAVTNDTLVRVGALAEEATGGIQQARAAASRVGALLGSGRSLLEGALGATVLRRLLSRRGGERGAGGGGLGLGALGTAGTVAEAAIALWRALSGLRRRSPSEEPAAANDAPPPPQSGLGTGPVRQISRRSAPLGADTPRRGG